MTCCIADPVGWVAVAEAVEPEAAEAAAPAAIGDTLAPLQPETNNTSPVVLPSYCRTLIALTQSVHLLLTHSLCDLNNHCAHCAHNKCFS